MNIERFRQVLAYIEEHPQEWDQASPYKCFMAHANFIAGDVNPLAPTGSTYLGFEDFDKQWYWIFNAARTLDDFRTVARRVYA